MHRITFWTRQGALDLNVYKNILVVHGRGEKEGEILKVVQHVSVYRDVPHGRAGVRKWFNASASVSRS